MTERVEELAAVLDPDAFDDNVPKSHAHAAQIQWAARRFSATRMAERAIAAGYERRREHVHSWMTLHGGKQQCHACREVRDTPPATPEQIEASRAFLAAQAEADALRKQVRG